MSWEAETYAGGWKFTPDDARCEIRVEFIHPTARGLEAWVELRVPDD